MLQESLLLLLGNTTLKSTAFQQALDGTYQCPEFCDIYTKKGIETASPTTSSDRDTRPDLQGIQVGMGNSTQNNCFITIVTTLQPLHSSLSKHNSSTILVNVSILSGSMPERWKQILNVMLQKLAGNDNMEKL